MTRQIKASEVREGMEIEWTSLGWYHRGVVSTVVRNDYAGVWVQSSDGIELSVEPDQVFTVLSEPQPDEPTAFGACVIADGVRFVRTLEAPTHWNGNDGYWCRWEAVCKRGHVRVVNADPFAAPAQDKAEPRVWDQWADVPRLTPVRVIETPYRKVGDHIECKPVNAWEPAFTDEYELNKFSPFTEVPGA